MFLLFFHAKINLTRKMTVSQFLRAYSPDDVIVTSCINVWYFFGINGMKRAMAIHWQQIWSYMTFSIANPEGVAKHPPSKHCQEKTPKNQGQFIPGIVNFVEFLVVCKLLHSLLDKTNCFPLLLHKRTFSFFFLSGLSPYMSFNYVYVLPLYLTPARRLFILD